MWWELLRVDNAIIIIGAIIGAIKANFNDNEHKSRSVRITNGLISIFCGMSVGYYYDSILTLWLNGLVALTTSMLSIAILDTLYLVTPTLTKTIIKFYTSLVVKK